MALDPRRRQKKIERRNRRQKEKKALARQNRTDPAARMQRAAIAPILHCCVSGALRTEGIGNVLVSRSLPDGNVAFAAFLVDIYCLGVKDVFWNIVPRFQYDSKMFPSVFRVGDVVQLKPESAHKLVEGAVEYAYELGLPPHRDYAKAKWIFGNIDARLSTDTFVFGKDGKPFFIAGPYDSAARCARIIDALTRRCGPDGFHYLVPVSGEEELFLPEHAMLLDQDAEG